MKIIVYHYTTRDSLRRIISSKTFNPSYLSPELDTTYGEGHYFTDLNPNSNNQIIASRLWNNPDTNKVEAYIAFEIDDSLLQKCRPNVYRLPIGIVKEEFIDINLNYVSDRDQNQIMIKYINHGLREMTGGGSLWKTVGNITLIGIAVLLVTKLLE